MTLLDTWKYRKLKSCCRMPQVNQSGQKYSELEIYLLGIMNKKYVAEYLKLISEQKWSELEIYLLGMCGRSITFCKSIEMMGFSLWQCIPPFTFSLSRRYCSPASFASCSCLSFSGPSRTIQYWHSMKPTMHRNKCYTSTRLNLTPLWGWNPPGMQ